VEFFCFGQRARTIEGRITQREKKKGPQKGGGGGLIPGGGVFAIEGGS